MKKFRLIGLILAVGVLASCNKNPQDGNLENQDNQNIVENQQDQENSVEEVAEKNKGAVINLDKRGDSLTSLTDEEMEVYEKFSVSYDDEELRLLDPLSFVKVFLYCDLVKDYETQYELYPNDNTLFTKEEYVNGNTIEKLNVDSVFYFKEVYNVEANFAETYESCTVTWNSALGETDENGDIQYKFNLVLDGDVWKADFSPME